MMNNNSTLTPPIIIWGELGDWMKDKSNQMKRRHDEHYNKGKEITEDELIKCIDEIRHMLDVIITDNNNVENSSYKPQYKITKRELKQMINECVREVMQHT